MNPPIDYFDERRIADRRKAHPHNASAPCPGGCDDIVIVESDMYKIKKDVTELKYSNSEICDRVTRLETKIETRFDDLTENVKQINTAVIDIAVNEKKNGCNIEEMAKYQLERKETFNVLERFGRLLMWVGGLGTALLTFLYAIKDWPKHG